MFLYVFISYIAFFGLLYSLERDAKFVKLRDLQTGEDWFYFMWLFGVPFLIDLLVIGLPVYYGLSRIARKSLLLNYSIFGAALLVDFMITKSIYGLKPAIYKVGASVALYFIFFGRKLISS